MATKKQRREQAEGAGPAACWQVRALGGGDGTVVRTQPCRWLGAPTHDAEQRSVASLPNYPSRSALGTPPPATITEQPRATSPTMRGTWRLTTPHHQDAATYMERRLPVHRCLRGVGAHPLTEGHISSLLRNAVRHLPQMLAELDCRHFAQVCADVRTRSAPPRATTRRSSGVGAGVPNPQLHPWDPGQRIFSSSGRLPNGVGGQGGHRDFVRGFSGGCRWRTGIGLSSGIPLSGSGHKRRVEGPSELHCYHCLLRPVPSSISRTFESPPKHG